MNDEPSRSWVPTWRRIVQATPVFRLWEALRRESDTWAYVLLAFVAAYGVGALCVPTSQALQREVMRVFHYRPSSSWSWVVLQPMPKMYGMRNLFRLKEQMPDGGDETLSVNHYPARFVVVGHVNGYWRTPRSPRHAVVSSRYRNAELRTEYVIESGPGDSVLCRARELP